MAETKKAVGVDVINFPIAQLALGDRIRITTVKDSEVKTNDYIVVLNSINSNRSELAGKIYLRRAGSKFDDEIASDLADKIADEWLKDELNKWPVIVAYTINQHLFSLNKFFDSSKYSSDCATIANSVDGSSDLTDPDALNTMKYWRQSIKLYPNLVSIIQAYNVAYTAKTLQRVDAVLASKPDILWGNYTIAGVDTFTLRAPDALEALGALTTPDVKSIVRLCHVDLFANAHVTPPRGFTAVQWHRYFSE